MVAARGAAAFYQVNPADTEDTVRVLSITQYTSTGDVFKRSIVQMMFRETFWFQTLDRRLQLEGGDTPNDQSISEDVTENQRGRW